MIALINTVESVGKFVEEIIKDKYNYQKVNSHVYPKWLEDIGKGVEFEFLYDEIENELNRLFESNEKVLVTCSSLREYIDLYKSRHSDKKIYKIDEPMLTYAGKNGTKIALVCTNTTTIKPSTETMLDVARMNNNKINITAVNCKSEIDEIRKNINVDDMYRVISEKIDKFDTIVLAQVSIAMVIDANKINSSAICLNSCDMGIKQIFD